jgi:osmotically-inducible protein OsmY
MHRNFLQTPAAAGGSKRLRCALALVALLSAAGVAPQALASGVAGGVAGATPDDVALATVVQNALLQDRLFQQPGVDIEVRAGQGKVNLSGWVAHASDDAAARRIAGAVSGVKSVTAALRSWSSESSAYAGGTFASAQTAPRAPSLIGATAADLALAQNVQAALLKDPVFQAEDVDIAVMASGDKVNLSGWMDDVADDTRARKIAAAVPGVKTVTSSLRAWSTDGESTPSASGVASVASVAGVVAAPAPSIIGSTDADRALASQVRTAVLQNPAFQGADVDVGVRADQGRVSLSGWVNYASNSLQAHRLAASVPGVKSVTSNFKSWSSESDPRL